MKHSLKLVFLLFPVLAKGFSQRSKNVPRLLPCHLGFSSLEKQKALKDKFTWGLYKKHLALFLTPICYDKVEKEKGPLEVSVLNRRASVRDPEMNPDALNVIWPVLPYGLDVKSIRADRIDLSWQSWFFNKHPLHVFVKGLEITLGDAADVPTLEARRIQKEWLDICGPLTTLDEYQVGDGCNVRLRNTEIKISSPRFPGGDVVVKIPQTYIASVDEHGQEVDLDECWKTNENRQESALIFKQVTTEGLHAFFESRLEAHGHSALRALWTQASTREGRLINSEGLSLTWTLEKRMSDHELVSQKVVFQPPDGALTLSVPPIFFDAGAPDLELLVELSNARESLKSTNRRKDSGTKLRSAQDIESVTSSDGKNVSWWEKTVDVVAGPLAWWSEKTSNLIPVSAADETSDVNRVAQQQKATNRDQLSSKNSTSPLLPLRKLSPPTFIKGANSSTFPPKSPRRGLLYPLRRLNISRSVSPQRIGRWMKSTKSKANRRFFKSLDLAGDTVAYFRFFKLLLRAGRHDELSDIRQTEVPMTVDASSTSFRPSEESQ